MKDDRGAPVEGAELHLRSEGAEEKTVALDPLGRASVEVAAGTYAVEAVAGGRRSSRFHPDREETVAAGERRPLEIVLPRNGTLRIAVTGAPAGRLRLRIARKHEHGSSTSTGTLTLDAEGRYEKSLEPGAIAVIVLAEPDGASAPQKLVIEPGVTTDASFALGLMPIVVFGRVCAKDGGRPIAGARVLGEGGASATTDEQGQFAIRSAGAIPERVSAAADGFVGKSVEIAHVEERAPPVEVAIELDPGGAIAIAVTDAAGKPVEGAGVSISWTPDEHSHSSSTLSTDAQGRCRFDSLAPLAYAVSIEKNEEHASPPPVQTVEVRAGEETPVRFTLPAK